ncbi:MAG: class I SAM-dependent methyltransferase [Clostridium sp.]|nr:class I SAM-dependent methyltransferase [Clostridium sp.]
MPISKNLEKTFDTVVSAYEKMRPGYFAGLESGCTLTAVEYGENFSGLCRKKFINYPKFSVMTGKFEELSFTEDAYDFVFSATAFHWVPEESGYVKVFAMLKKGGAFARFANNPDPGKENPALKEEMDRLYDTYYSSVHKRKQPVRKAYGEEQAKQRAMIAEKYGFGDIRYYLFHRERVFSAAEYTALLGTYFDHIIIEESVRKEFFAGIEEAIKRHGGTITIYDTLDLELARKV